MQHQIAAMAMEGCQNRMGENEIRSGLIEVGGRLEMDGVTAFNKKPAYKRTGIDEEISWTIRMIEEVRGELAVQIENIAGRVRAEIMLSREGYGPFSGEIQARMIIHCRFERSL